jgi:hypothetical protein
MKKRANLMFLKNKALTVFRFGHKEDPEAAFLKEWAELELKSESSPWVPGDKGKEGLKGTDGISPEDLSKLNKKDTK